MTSRASAIEPTSPAAIACIITLPIAVASIGPATTRAGRHRPSSGKAADSACRRRRCESSRSVRRSVLRASPARAVFHRQAFERTANHGPFVFGHSLTGAPAKFANRLRHVGRRQKAWIVRIDERRSGLAAAAAIQILPGIRRARLAPDAAALLHQPQAGDVLQQPRRAADAAFVREIQRQALFVDHRPRYFDPISDHVPD